MFKTTKSKIIFVVIFCTICIVATTLIVLYKNIDIEPEQQEEVIEENTSKEKDVQGVNLKGTYNQNDIKVERRTFKNDKLEIEYCQISGLKKVTIQDKINKEIENTAINCYKEKANIDNMYKIYVYIGESANFADVMSFYVSYSAFEYPDSDTAIYGDKGLNFDLNTGEKITLDKMFTSDAPIEDILRKSAYYGIIEYRTEDTLTGDFEVKDYGNIEEDIAYIIEEYKRGRITEFVFSPRYVTLYYGEHEGFSIDMIEYPEYYAIYHRYLSKENLYQTENITYKNLYNFTDRFPDAYEYKNYQKEYNYLIDISMMCYVQDRTEFDSKLINEKINNIEKEIQNLKKTASENQNNFYIMNYSINIGQYEDFQTKQEYTLYTEEGNTYEMTINDFKETIEPQVIKYNIDMSNIPAVPLYVYDFSETLKISPKNTEEYYIPETGEKIVV